LQFSLAANDWRAKEHPTARSRFWHWMRSRAEDYYRRGLEAQQHGAQAAAEPRIKKAFEQVADNWFTLAEQVQWLEQVFRPAVAGFGAMVFPFPGSKSAGFYGE